MSWCKPVAKWPWRDFLTEEEAKIILRADNAKAEWKRLVAEKAMIQNRALQRAKYAAATPTQEPHA
jgi:hypothetical protein